MDKVLMVFIEYHKLDFADFFDAKGLPVNSCYNEMKVSDKLFAYNTTPCLNFRHTVRDRQGHCVMCNTANIAFSLRKKQIGNVYIACSLSKEFTKVGMTIEKVESRLSKLNSRKVGNTDDWLILSTIKCINANSIELLVHSELDKYRVQGDFYGETESKEIFRCSYQKAKELLDAVLKVNNIKIIEQESYVSNTDKYKFRNLISRR